jgi:transposase
MLYCVQMGVVMVKRYRQFSGEFKFGVVMQLLTREKTISELCREHQLKDSLVYRWRDELLARGAQVYQTEHTSGEAAAQARIAELERMIGRLTMELEGLKKASSLLGSRGRNGGR